MQKFFRYCQKVRMGTECTDKETYFHKGIKENYDRSYVNKISVPCALHTFENKAFNS